MKLREHRPRGKGRDQRKSSLPKDGSPVEAITPLSRSRIWLFRVAAMVLGPLFVLGGVEVGLRLTGYGYSTNYFVRTTIQGKEFYVPNASFTFRFFSPEQARSSVPIRVAADKSTNTYRIFLFGESAANGDPDSSFGVARYLEVLLRERFPKTDFEVLNVAITGINSHTIVPIARECARREGDLWVVYMGNNEMVGPFGAETVFGPRAPSVGFVRATLAVKSTRVGQGLDALARRLRPHSASGESWGGMQMFVENRLPYDDPARRRAYANFEENLEDILRLAQRAGVPVILSTVAVNLKDCAPFASLHSPGLSEADETAWSQAYEEGVALETAGSYREAVTLYRKAAEIDPYFADLQFRMGTCDLALTNPIQARQEFQRAVDCDALAFRADSPINQSIRAAARRASRGVHLVDAAEALAQQSPDAIPGCEFFYEHVHFNFDGNYLLALTLAEQTGQLLPEWIRARDQGSWATGELCDRRLAATVWDRQRVWQPIFNRISFPPFTDQLNHATFFKMCEAKLEHAKMQMSSQTPEQARQIYAEALALAPEDQFLHANFEQFLEAGGELTQATAEAQRVCELIPFLPTPHYRAGTLLVRQGRTQEAAECFRRAVALDRRYAQAYNELGWILACQQKTEEAIACFARARRADPNCAETFINLGFLQQSRGESAEATANYLKAAQLQPGGPGDYFNRANLAFNRFQWEESIALLKAIVASKPDCWQARYLLGTQLATLGRADDAQLQLTEIIRYRPDYAPAHFQLGTTLVALGKTEAALDEFRTTLKLDPHNTAAQAEVQRLGGTMKGD